MIPRRNLLSGGVLGSLLGLFAGAVDAEAAPDPGFAQQQRIPERGAEQIAEAIGELRTEVRNQRAFTEIAGIREAQKQFLRVNGKFPDFVEVGSDIWFAVHDWHIRWRQPLALGRDTLGRYTIVLNQTTIVLRPETAGNFVSLPYDNK
jgi:hypothetical protein